MKRKAVIHYTLGIVLTIIGVFSSQYIIRMFNSQYFEYGTSLPLINYIITIIGYGIIVALFFVTTHMYKKSNTKGYDRFINPINTIVSYNVITNGIMIVMRDVEFASRNIFLLMFDMLYIFGTFIAVFLYIKRGIIDDFEYDGTDDKEL